MSNNFKINRGNIGVYVSTSLLFGGIGLLIGSIIANKLFYEETEDTDEYEAPTISLVERYERFRALYDKPDLSDVQPTVPTISDIIGGGDEIDADDDEIDDSIHEDDYDKHIEIAMEIARDKIFDGDSDVVEDRFEITTEDPRRGGQIRRITKLVWREESDSVFVVRGNRAVEFNDNSLSEEVITRLRNALFTEPVPVVYAVDSENGVAFSFELGHDIGKSRKVRARRGPAR